MTIFEKKQSLLAVELDRYVMEHPEFAARIPRGAQIVIEVEGEKRFNAWARSLAARQREPGQPVVRVRTKGLMPARSRLESPVIRQVR